MHELCDACQSASYCRQSGCIPLVSQDGGETVEFGTQAAWFEWLGICLACALFAIALALSAGWVALK